MSESLPAYSDEALAANSTPELLQLLIRDEDRVARNVIDECVRRGDEMAESLAGLLRKDYYWSDDQTPGEGWLLLHAVMILGLMPDARAGALLVDYLRRRDDAGGENLQEWLPGHWPAFFRNKPQSVIVALRDLAQDRNMEPFVRADAAEIVVARAKSLDGACLDEALAWAAGIAFDEKEDLGVRMSVGELLLDFARPEYRAGLEELAIKAPAWETAFTQEEVGEVYACSDHEEPDWSDSDPWSFYAPEAIEARQHTWAQEQGSQNNNFFDEPGETYVKSTPKIGRNDPCPCGSGKKYKKCCLK